MKIKEKLRNVIKNPITWIVICLIVGILSFFVLADVCSSTDCRVNADAAASLRHTRKIVTGITITTTAASIAIAAVPGDSTTPIADKVADLSSYLLVLLIAINLELGLITLMGFLAFKILIPIACEGISCYSLLHGMPGYSDKELNSMYMTSWVRRWRR